MLTQIETFLEEDLHDVQLQKGVVKEEYCTRVEQNRKLNISSQFEEHNRGTPKINGWNGQNEKLGMARMKMKNR